jgi:hypothetical protein
MGACLMDWSSKSDVYKVLHLTVADIGQRQHNAM